MTRTGFDPVPGKPVWLMTLADLALLLVGFFVFLQAVAPQGNTRVLAKGFREGFGTAASALAPIDPAPVAAAAMPGFAAGDATLPTSPAAVIAWVRDAAQDPRVTITLTGSWDGTAADVDDATGSGVVLALDRARALASALAQAKVIAPDRITIRTRRATAGAPPRAVLVTLSYAG